MSLNTVSTMAHDGDLQQRFIACAAQESIEHPEDWVRDNIWQLVADTDAVASYQYSLDGPTGWLGQIGKRDDVINATKILSIVQARKTALAQPPG